MISQATADKMAYMLEAVVGPGGTAPLGQIEGFRVAGKTGTAQRANPECNCYEGGGYVTTFVGFAPADDPQYVVAVDLERPHQLRRGRPGRRPGVRRRHAVRAHRRRRRPLRAPRGRTSSSTAP